MVDDNLGRSRPEVAPAGPGRRGRRSVIIAALAVGAAAVYDLPDRRYQQVKAGIFPVDGTRFRTHSGQTTLTPDLAAHVIGTVGPITADQLKLLGAPYQANDSVGSASLRTMMAAVVTSGTGSAANLPRNPPVAGKTGTAEFGTASPPMTHAWLIGYRGDLAFAVLVEGGGVGARVAVPIAAKFLTGLS